MLSHMHTALGRAAAALFVVALFTAQPANARKLKCPGLQVVVESSRLTDAVRSCRGARSAVRFLTAQGMAMPPSISIKIAARLPEDLPRSALGAYSRNEKQIYVLDYAEFRRRHTTFKVPADPSIYQAVISHEVAHAIAFHNFRSEPTLLGQEYIAFVTFFTTLRPALRQEILWRYDYDESWQLYAVILYLTDALEFGAHAYRHFLRQENGQRYLQRILNGEVLSIDN